MTSRLREHGDDLAALVAQTATARDLPSPHVEKDFWVTEVLRAATVEREVDLPDGMTEPVRFVFKGGTSLSRVFGIIERFSEDVDLLAVFPEAASDQAQHRVLKNVDAAVTTHLGLTRNEVTVGASTTGVKRYTTYRYPAEAPDDDLADGVLLELGSRGGAHPATSHHYRSIVAEYAIAELGESENAWEEFSSFEVNVLAPERTLLEKVAAVHDAAVRNDAAALHKHGRHFYDIDRLLNTPTVIDGLASLGEPGFAALVDDINARSEEAGFSWSARPENGYADSPAFDPTHESHASILAGYERARHLIHGTRVTLDQVLATVAEHRAIL